MSLPLAFPQPQHSTATRLHQKWSKNVSSLALMMLEKLHFIAFAEPRSTLFGLAFGSRNFSIGENARIKGRGCISIGDNFKALDRLWLESTVNGDADHAHLGIGSDVSCRDSVHITATNRVRIGSHVLIGSRVNITDQKHGLSHGQIQSDPEQTPWERVLSAGAQTVIEDNVWLGDGVVVLGGSYIGRGSIIGSNSTVNGFIPPRSIAVGNPAKPIRRFDAASKTWMPIKDPRLSRPVLLQPTGMKEAGPGVRQ